MLKVRKPGFYSSLQDNGRFQLRHLGVPVSGCLDQVAYHQCNKLLKNQPNATVLEMSMTGAEVEFTEPTFICITGAFINPYLNKSPLNNYQIYQVHAGDVLSFKALTHGFRCYLGVKDGFQTEKVLGSASQYIPVTSTATITQGQTIAYTPINEFAPEISEMKPGNYFGQQELQVYKGPEFDTLEDSQIDRLLEGLFTIAKENNRMAYQLEELVENSLGSMFTSATLPGTVQLTPAGKLIILMRDGQTTGGYPRVLQLSEQAISSLAQKKATDKIRFELVYT